MEKKQYPSLEIVDRISNLPDLVRAHIVSFLPLKDAVRNTILSSKWLHICSSLTNLDFRQICHRRDFKDIIDRVLFLHVGQHVHKFTLSVGDGSKFVDPLHLNTWISFALRRNVVEFILENNLGEIGLLPCSLYKSSTLVVLDLCDLDLMLPTRVYFPVLETLKLRNIAFPNEHLTAKLFSNCCCPRLLNLEILYSYFNAFTTLSICSASLKFLKLEDCDDNYALNIYLSTPSLHEIDFNHSKLPEISLETLSSLFIATFDLTLLHSTSEAMQNLACKTLIGLQNLEKLRLRGRFIELLTRIQDLSACLPTTPCGLKQMELHVESTKIKLEWIISLLRCYPNLQALFIHFYGLRFEDTVDIPHAVLSMNHFLLSEVLSSRYIPKNLGSIRIENFHGSRNELNFVGYVLENAPNLERMDIQLGYYAQANVESPMRIRDMLLMLPRISPRARIYIS